MDRRLWHIILLMFLWHTIVAQGDRILQPGDSLYKSIDLLPESILTSPGSGTGFWDFSSLLAPYVHEVYVRPVSSSQASELSADLAMMDADGTERFATVSEGGLSLAGFRTPLDGKHAYTGICTPAMPWRATVPQLGEPEVYEGTCTFSIPEDRHQMFGSTDVWAADSMRVVVEYRISTAIDARGAMLTPSGQYAVMRERKVVETRASLERKSGGDWITEALSGEIQLPVELQSGTIHTFWNSELPDPVAVVHTDRLDKIRRVAFRATPHGGRLVSNFPKVADVFVYPNPSFGEVRFDFVNLEPGQYSLDIYNILGVKQRTIGPLDIDGNRTIPVDLSDLKKGTYIYRLVDRNQSALRSKRLVIITP